MSNRETDSKIEVFSKIISDLVSKVSSMQYDCEKIDEFFSENDQVFHLNVKKEENPKQICRKEFAQTSNSLSDDELISNINIILENNSEINIKAMKRRYECSTIYDFANYLTYKQADFSIMINKLEKSMSELLKIRGAYIQRRSDTLRKLRHIRRQQRKEFSNFDLVDSVVDEIDSSMKLLKVKLNSIPPKEPENNIIDQLSQLFQDSNE